MWYRPSSLQLVALVEYDVRSNEFQEASPMSTALHLTTDEFDAMVERGAFNHLLKKIELFRGELREMNPAGPLHDGLIVYLNNWSVLEASKYGMLVTAQTGLNLVELDSRPEPDLMWLIKASYRKSHPCASDVRLAIEVSDCSLRSDLYEKARLYAEAKIVEYWIVDANAKWIHVFRQPVGGQFTERTIAMMGQKTAPLAAPQAELDVGDLFEEE